MRQVFRRIPVYTGDVSGVCSALFELGGMVVMHDPSGCNSTYNTHDEIRWYDHDSLIFLSGLNEMEAVMGSDEALIRDITESARIYSPAFITIVNSPIPYITGIDFDAISRLIEEQTGIPTFYTTTNGMHDYTRGAGLAFLHLAERFLKTPDPFAALETAGEPVSAASETSGESALSAAPDRDGSLKSGCPDRKKIRCNILGLTPLDYASTTSISSLRARIEDCGLEIVSCWAMGDTLENISNSTCADVNLVVSTTGFKAAQYMYRTYGIPYIVGFPAAGTEKVWLQAVRSAVHTGENRFPFRDRARMQVSEKSAGASAPVCLIGEPVIMTSLAASVQLRTGTVTHVLGATEGGEIFLGAGDAALCGEEELEKALSELNADSGIPAKVVADPYYGDILPKGCELIPLPHLAFSGRILLKEIPDLLEFVI